MATSDVDEGVFMTLDHHSSAINTVGSQSPKVSICIPTRNYAHYLKAAITSVFEQTFDNYEVIIVDNDSTDATETLVRELAKQDNRMRYIKNDSNIGLCENFNRCLSYANGEYIKFLCADDILHPTCVERMTKCLDENPSALLVSGGSEFIDESGGGLGFERYSDKDKYVAGHDAIQRCLFGKNYIGPPTSVMFRNVSVNRGFREDLKHLVDLEFWFYLLEHGGLVVISDPVCLVRNHSEQFTKRNIRSGVLVEDNLLLFDEYKNKSYIKPTFIDRFGHVIRIAYRVWLSRKYLTNIRRTEILKRYSSIIIYYSIIPIIYFGIVASSGEIWRQLDKRMALTKFSKK